MVVCFKGCHNMESHYDINNVVSKSQREDIIFFIFLCEILENFIFVQEGLESFSTIYPQNYFWENKQ